MQSLPMFDRSTTQTTNPPTETLIAISLDYDGCGQYLFENGMHLDYFDKEYIRGESEFFRDHLLSITKDQTTELYVGSNRQDRFTDLICNNRNLNGSCFNNFEILVNEMRQAGRNWSFNKLLLSDIISRDKNCVIKQRGLGMDNKFKIIPQHLLQNLNTDSSINLKLNIIVLQLNDIAENHPDKIVNFYFYDDDIGISDRDEPSIFETFKAYFTNFPQAKPANINLFLMHFDPYAREQMRAKNMEPNPELEYWSSKVVIESENGKPDVRSRSRRYTM